MKDLNISYKDSENEPSWLERTRKNRTFYRPNDFYSLSNGDYLVIFSDNGVAVADNLPGRTYEMSLLNSADGKYIRHNILSFDWTGGVLLYDSGQRTSVMFRVPYKRTSEYDYSNGKLVYGWTEDFLFKFYDEEGNYRHAFYYPFDKHDLSEEDALDYYENDDAIEALRNDTLPDTWPAFNTVLMDDENHIWVSRFTDNSQELGWMVFESSGALLAEFRWPRSRDLMEVKDGYAYVLNRETDTGLPEITRYRIGMN